MTKYLIFKNDPASEKVNAPGSPEQVACEIICAVDMYGSSPEELIASAVDSQQATYELLKSKPRFSVELDSAKISLWKNEAQPILKKIYIVHEAIGSSYGVIVEAIRDLESFLDKSKNFQDSQLTSEIDIERAFEYLVSPSEFDFATYVEEIFDVKTLGK